MAKRRTKAPARARAGTNARTPKGKRKGKAAHPGIRSTAKTVWQWLTRPAAVAGAAVATVTLGLVVAAWLLMEQPFSDQPADAQKARVTVPVMPPTPKPRVPVPQTAQAAPPAPPVVGVVAAAVTPVPWMPAPKPLLPVAMRPPALPAPVPAGAPQWLKNAVPFPQPLPRPAIAVVIDDMGVDRARSARVVGLPGPLTLAWLPYAGDLRRQTRSARAAGHELMVHLPMEPQGGDADPGPGALLVSLGQSEQMRRLDQSLAAFDGFIGVNNHMGSRFTEDSAGMTLVLAELQRRGLMFLDSRTTGNSVAPEVALRLKLPEIGRDVFLDHDMTPAEVAASLRRTEETAHRHGYAIAIGHPHDVTVDALVEWLPGLAARGFTLVPVSAILRAKLAGGDG